MRAAVRTLPALFLLAAAGSPALAWDPPEAIVGAYILVEDGAPPETQACELELLPPLVHEFEGVWYVARPLYYEANRDACAGLGVDGVIAWSAVAGSLWLLAEGEAGFMDFRADGEDWRLSKSGHERPPALVLRKIAELD